jgi:hypothetical protein
MAYMIELEIYTRIIGLLKPNKTLQQKFAQIIVAFLEPKTSLLLCASA